MISFKGSNEQHDGMKTNCTLGCASVLNTFLLKCRKSVIRMDSSYKQTCEIGTDGNINRGEHTVPCHFLLHVTL